MIAGAAGSPRAVVERLVEAYNAKDLDAHRSLHHEDARYWSVLGGWHEGREAVAEHVAHLFTVLPDEQMSVVRMAADDETVVMEVEGRGTAGTGEPYVHRFTEVLEVRDGRIRSVKVYLDPEELAGLA